MFYGLHKQRKLLNDGFVTLISVVVATSLHAESFPYSKNLISSNYHGIFMGTIYSLSESSAEV